MELVCNFTAGPGYTKFNFMESSKSKFNQMATCNFEPFRQILKQKNVFLFYLENRTGIGRGSDGQSTLKKHLLLNKTVVFFTKFESDGERTGTDGERTGNGRERTGNGRVGIC